jgi:hypothetical protein
MINYDIITMEDDKNIVIRLNVDKELEDSQEIIKIMHLVQTRLSLSAENRINEDTYNNINNSIIDMYANKFIKV